MMKFFTKLFLLGLVLSVFSCDEESETEEDVNLLVGEWALDSYVIANVPSDFSGWEDYELQGTLWGESSYAFIFNEDGTYTRSLAFLDTSGEEVVFSEEGDWEEEDSFLELDPEGSEIGINEEFDVVEVDDKDLVLSIDINFDLIPDLYYDTVTTEYTDYLDSLFVADIDLYGDVVDELFQTTAVTINYEFDRSDD